MFLGAAALMVVAACTKENGADMSSADKVSLTAYTENAQSKAVMGQNSGSKLQIFWEDGDAISVYSSNEGTGEYSKFKTAYEFTTALDASSASAVFTYSGEDFIPGEEYFALYPYKSGTHTVNLSTKASVPMTIPQDQTLVPGSFDRSTAISYAYSTDGSTLNFKNIVALIKFRVADADVVSGSIVTSSATGANITGTYRLDNFDDPTAIPLSDYGETINKSVNFSIDGNTPLQTDTDYYVAIRPAGLYGDGFKVYLNGTLVKTYTNEVLQTFERNTIYNLGTLSIPDVRPLELTFNFTDATAMADWPVEGNYTTVDTEYQIERTYKLDDVDYKFYLANPTKSAVKYAHYKGGLRIPQNRFIGLPVIEGMRPMKVSFKVSAINTNGTEKAGVTTVLPEYESSNLQYLENCYTNELAKGTFTFYLTDKAESGTVYYLFSGNTIIISSMSLTYVKADQATEE